MLNQVSLNGRLTKDVELKVGETIQYSIFTIAVKRNRTETDFIEVIAFGDLAINLSKYQGKGNMIAVIGKLNTGSYEKEGRTIFYTRVNASEIYYLDKKN